jgi:microcystin-dependent protein
MVRRVHPIYEINSYSDQVHIWLWKHLICCVISFLGAGAQYSPTQTGGSSSQTATITVNDMTLTTAQMPSHSHGGSTGAEDISTIYYDVYSTPCTSGMFKLVDVEIILSILSVVGPFGTGLPRWVNTQAYNNCNGCQHSHSIASEGSDQPHTHTADMTPIDVTPPFVALLYIMKI